MREFKGYTTVTCNLSKVTRSARVGQAEERVIDRLADVGPPAAVTEFVWLRDPVAVRSGAVAYRNSTRPGNCSGSPSIGPADHASNDSTPLRRWYAAFLNETRRDDDEAEHYFLKALELDSNHVNSRLNYALFLERVRQDHAQAEKEYLRALELEPGNIRANGLFGTFLWLVKKRYEEAEVYYRKTLEIDSSSGDALANYAGFLLERNRLNEAKAMADRAWALYSGAIEQGAAEVAWYQVVIAALQKKDTGVFLGRLKALLQADYRRTWWSFEGVLSSCVSLLKSEEITLVRALSEAILDKAKLPALEQLPMWKNIKPTALQVPTKALG
jgi:Tfp pilus assembly protein PilF